MAFLCFSFGLSFGFPLALLWFSWFTPFVVQLVALVPSCGSLLSSYGCLFCFSLFFLAFSFGFPLIFRVLSSVFPIGFLWFPYCFPLAFLCFFLLLSFAFSSSSSSRFDMLLNVCIDSFWVSFLGHSGCHFGGMLGSFWCHFELMLEVFRGI